MKYSIHSKKTRVFMLIITILCLVLGIHCIVSIEKLSHFTTPFALYIMNTILAIIAFTAASKQFRYYSEKVAFHDEQLVYYCFWQKQRAIRWEDLKEVGVGQVYTPKGIAYRIFFSRAELTDAEIDNLDLAKDKCMYFEEITEETFDLIQKNCPIEIPAYVNTWVRRKEAE